VDEGMVTHLWKKEKANVKSQSFSTGACFIDYRRAGHKRKPPDDALPPKPPSVRDEPEDHFLIALAQAV
jgi:hypothetical protein